MFRFTAKWLISVALAAQVVACSAVERVDFDSAAYFSEPSARLLAEAACEGRSEIITQIVSTGTSPNVVGRKGYTPLMAAVSCQSEIGVSELLRSGADPNARNEHGANSVWIAAGMENTDILRSLLQHDGDMDVVAGGDRTPLIRSLSPFVSTANFELLLRSGVDVNQVSEGSGTAAEAAIAYGRIDLAIQLMEAGYNHDLLGLAYDLESRQVSSARLESVNRLQRMLEERGVSWPLPELLDDDGRTNYMTSNPDYASAHPESWPVGHSLHPDA